MSILDAAWRPQQFHTRRVEDRPGAPQAERRDLRDAVDTRESIPPGGVRCPCAAAESGRRARASHACALIRPGIPVCHGSIVKPAACVTAELHEQIGAPSSAPSMSNAGMLRQEPCASPSSSTARSTACGTRRRASRRRCRSRRDATRRRRPRARVRAESGSVSITFLAAATMPASSSWRREFSPSNCSASARASSHRLVAGEQQARGDVRRAHASRGVDARRQHEADVKAVERLAEQPGRFEQRPQADVCGPFDSRSSPSFAMTRFSPTSGTTSATVPIAAIFTNAGSHFSRPTRGRAPGPASARHRRRRDACRGSRSRGASG